MDERQPTPWDFTLGDRMRKALQVAGLSVNEIAAEFGVHRQTVTRWLNDQTEPHLATLRQFAERTGAPLAWLVGECSRTQDGPPPGVGDGPHGQGSIILLRA